MVVNLFIKSSTFEESSLHMLRVSTRLHFLHLSRPQKMIDFCRLQFVTFRDFVKCALCNLSSDRFVPIFITVLLEFCRVSNLYYHAVIMCKYVTICLTTGLPIMLNFLSFSKTILLRLSNLYYDMIMECTMFNVQ